MKTEIYDCLIELRQHFGPREFGKICQKLLAIAFKTSGYTHVVERGVQGVDIDAAGKDGIKYTLEVKTTLTSFFAFEQKDYEGLQQRKQDGYEPLLAALRLDRFSDWIFSKADKLNPGRIYIDLLKLHRIEDLEESICPFFDEAVIEHFDRTMNEGQGYLDSVLKNKDIKVE